MVHPATYDPSHEAVERGLGDHDPASIEIAGDLEPTSDFKVTRAVEKAAEIPTITGNSSSVGFGCDPRLKRSS
ncbi:MAG: hypothetical protein ACE5K2_06965, partial [Candidatus Zixiibacteriota bacterium]